MDVAWVIVADNARARFFNWQTNRQLVEFETMVCPDQRLHESELVSDRQGRIGTSASGHHGVGHADGFKEQERKLFAAHIAARIGQGRTSNQFKKLVLMAPPQCLGRIRARLDDPCEKMIVHTINKELTRLSPEGLAEYLPAHL